MDSDFKTALVQSTKRYDADLLRPALVRRTIYTFALAENPAAFVALVNGAVPGALTWKNTIFWLDETDTTTPHDGVTVIRTSDNYCYKVEDIDMRVRSVRSFTVTAPPVSPSVGDSYLVPAGATGAWSSHQDDIATYTPRGWVFEEAGLGRQLQVEDKNGMVRYSATGWVYGYGSQAFTAASIPYSASLGWGERIIVENQTTATPPTATKGLRYVVGASANGAWLGQDKKIAICQVGGSWTFYTPEDGLVAFDKALQSDYRWSSATTAWVSAAGSWVGRNSVSSGSGTTTAPSGTAGYSYSTTTAPTTSQRRLIDNATALTYTAKKSSAVLRFDYTADAVFSLNVAASGFVATTGPVVIALFRDTVANALAWKFVPAPIREMRAINEAFASLAVANVINTASFGVREFFEIAAPDTVSHSYFVAIMSSGNTNAPVDATTLTRRLLTVQEAA